MSGDRGLPGCGPKIFEQVGIAIGIRVGDRASDRRIGLCRKSCPSPLFKGLDRFGDGRHAIGAAPPGIPRCDDIVIGRPAGQPAVIVGRGGNCVIKHYVTTPAVGAARENVARRARGSRPV